MALIRNHLNSVSFSDDQIENGDVEVVSNLKNFK